MAMIFGPVGSDSKPFTSYLRRNKFLYVLAINIPAAFAKSFFIRGELPAFLYIPQPTRQTAMAIRINQTDAGACSPNAPIQLMTRQAIPRPRKLAREKRR